MGVDNVETRMTDHVPVGGRNYLLGLRTDGTVSSPCFPTLGNTMDREFDVFNCDLRPDQG
jgi:hypothetical protein